MTTSVTITITLEELDAILRKIVREEMQIAPVMINAKQAKALLGINNHATFNRMIEIYGVQSVSTGKTARYRMQDILDISNRKA